MNMTDFHGYYLPAARVILGEAIVQECLNNPGYEALMYFDKLIGIDVVSGFAVRLQSQDFPLSNEHRELLQKLAGPNGKFYLAVRKARLTKDDHHEDTSNISG